MCAIPLVVSLSIPYWRAKRSGALANYKSPYQMLGAKQLAIALFWQLDIIGIILMIAVFALILVPFTIAGGASTTWRTAHVIAPLVIGVLCIPAWVYWESKCKHPMVPFKLLKDRAVWSALGVAWMFNFAWYLQGDYLYTVLAVAFNESVLSATRIQSLYSFCSVITGLILGLIVFKVRYLKPFIIPGVVLFFVAFGLLIHFRSGFASNSHSGIIGAQILLGIAGGMFAYPTQNSIQAATRHEHVAVITGLYLATYSIGAAFGNTVSGAIWTQVLPNQLAIDLAPFNNATLVTYFYGSPVFAILDYPVGTPERAAVITAYQHVQRLLCITGICLCVPFLIFALLLRNPRLGNEQSLPDAEVSEGEAGKVTPKKPWYQIF